MALPSFKTVGFLFLSVLSSTSLAQALVVTCVPNEVGQFDLGSTYSRVHIRCQSPINDGGGIIYFFSMPSPIDTTPASLAIVDRLISISTTAIATGKNMVFEFVSGDQSGSSFGCDYSNCRRIIGFALDK